MTAALAFPSLIRRLIQERIGDSELRISDIAAEVHCSRAQLQRILGKAGTCFRAEVHQVRLERALGELSRGKQVQETAAAVGISPDHLLTVVRPVVGLTPGEIRMAADLGKFLAWLRETPPARSGTSLYYSRRQSRLQAERRLTELLDRVLPDAARWEGAEDLRLLTNPPDYRRGPFRALARRARREEAEREAAIWESLDSLEAALLS